MICFLPFQSAVVTVAGVEGCDGIMPHHSILDGQDGGVGVDMLEE